MKSFVFGSIFGVVMAIGSAASAATIANGSFENPGTFAGNFHEVAAGDTDIDNWTVSGGGVDLINRLWQHSDGDYSLDMSRTSAGTISQTVTGLVVGTTYKILFDMAGNTGGGNVIKSLSAGIGMAGGGVFNFDTTGHTTAGMGWETKSFTFVAGAISGLLSFSSNENNAYGPALDNIRIQQVAAVPVPAGGILLLSALGGLIAARRRRKS